MYSLRPLRLLSIRTLRRTSLVRIGALLGLCAALMGVTQPHAQMPPAPAAQPTPTGAERIIRIGDVNSYHSPAHVRSVLEHYYKGMELAVAQVNASGGIAGKKLHLSTRDDQSSAQGARHAAADLWDRARVDVLIGGWDSEAAQALREQAQQRQRLFLAVAALTAIPTAHSTSTWQLRPPLATQAAMLVPDAAKLHKTRWAIVHTDDAQGRAAAERFQADLSRTQPGVQFVLTQAVPTGTLDQQADTLAQALLDAAPDAIFHTLWGDDLAPWVQAAQRRGALAGRSVVSVLAGEPESLDTIKNDPPEGWIVTGYPWYAIDTNMHDGFFTAYRKRFKDYPRTASVLGYSAIESLVAALRTTGGNADNAQLAKAFENLQVHTPWGPITYRAHDHQSTLGSFVGTTGLLRGKGAMVRFRYVDAAAFLPRP